MRFVFKMIVFPFWLLTAFLALMLKWTLNLSAFVLALPMLYIFGCGLYTLYCREWLQFLILLVAEFGCFVLIFMGALIAVAAERFSGWVAGLRSFLILMPPMCGIFFLPGGGRIGCNTFDRTAQEQRKVGCGLSDKPHGLREEPGQN